MKPCDDLTPFADGELSPERADAFRAHLVTCDRCCEELTWTMALNARLSLLKRQQARRKRGLALTRCG